MAPLRGRRTHAACGSRSRVAAGSTTSKLALNTDYLPTFADLAGVQRPPYVDGRSLRPVLEGNATTWRNAILLEGTENTTYAPAYRGIRTVSTDTTGTERKYVEYEGTKGNSTAWVLTPTSLPTGMMPPRRRLSWSRV